MLRFRVYLNPEYPKKGMKFRAQGLGFRDLGLGCRDVNIDIQTLEDRIGVMIGFNGVSMF